ncbi:DUF6344 domain-containing protein [Streptomyces sp. NPDC051018]|uniref:DUF6344 domain-containing protein n=1 Tax=Streptomyces sp. NPDC051018 TaxID=3365639 RepID=UPI00379F4D5E
MTCAKVRNLWTAFLGALVALLASLGLTGSIAARRAAVRTPDEPAQPKEAVKAQKSVTPREPARSGGPGLSHRERERVQERERAARTPLSALVPAQSTRWNAGARVRSLPPTIKQRIRAEAHGASPSVRKLPAFDLDGPLTVRAVEAVADRALGGDRSRAVDRALVPAGTFIPDSRTAGDAGTTMDGMLSRDTSENSGAPEGRGPEDTSTPGGPCTAVSRIPAHSVPGSAPVSVPDGVPVQAPGLVVPAQDAPVSLAASAGSARPGTSADEPAGTGGPSAAPPAFAPLRAVPLAAAVSSSDTGPDAPDRTLTPEHDHDHDRAHGSEVQRPVTHLAQRPVRNPGAAAHTRTGDLAAA